MENAAKALEMAGSVLIGLLILGCLVFAYTNLADEKKIEQDSLRAEQSKDFNKPYEAYNRKNLYGSDVLSVANMIESYNKIEAENPSDSNSRGNNVNKSYDKIDIKITVTRGITGAKYFTSTLYNSNEINTCYNKLSEEIMKVSNYERYPALKRKIGSKNLNHWANYGTGDKLFKEIKKQTGIQINEGSPDANNLIRLINDYNDLINEQKEMARKNFECIRVEYAKTGRIKSMEFREK